ncbi:MAG: SPFH domain-containing protein [Candidatus Poribacteria bacterium]|nr:SPFH domain-containing protein [Candidatus Poribacteria bacterium]
MRLILAVIFLIVVVCAIGYFAYNFLMPDGDPNGDQNQTNESNVLRWMGVIAVVLFGALTVSVLSVIRYRIPKADIALVRTGGAKEKIRITGGLWVNTIIHEIKEISLNTMRIEVVRETSDSLITNDFNRADVEVVFYLKVDPEEDDILKAAQALGDKSMTPETIRELIEPMLDGAIRSVAAESEIQDLLQKRLEFADKVQDACGENLKLDNGLTLDTVSIIRVDQTPIEMLNADNRFDAVGIREITEITAEQERDKEAAIKAKDVAIEQINVEARIQILEAEQEQAWAESDQQKNIAVYAVEREAETIIVQFEKEQVVQEREYEMKLEVERARISQEEGVQLRDIELELEVQTAKFAQEQQVQQREIEKNLVVETAQIDQTKVVQLAEIAQHLTVQMEKIEQEQTIEVREIEKQLMVEKARIAQEEGVQLRDVERDLTVLTAKFAQEQQVQQREIEKNLVVETAQIDQNKHVELTEIAKTLAVEVNKIGMEQQVQEREFEKQLFVEKARIVQEEGVELRDVERDLTVQTAKFAQEQQVQQREIEKNLVVETAQIDQNKHVELTEINKMLTVEQARIGQELRVALTDEDRKIDVANKQQLTALAEKEKLVAEAERMGAEINVTATEQVLGAEWQRDVAIIGAEAQAQPIERLADAVLSEARAKAQGEMAEYEARNVAEQRVLVQEAILELIEEAPDIVEQMMRPVEKIDNIKILDMGNSDGRGGVNRSSMGRLANALLDTGVISPMLKELFNFADVDAGQITDKIAEYLADLVNRPSDAPEVHVDVDVDAE